MTLREIPLQHVRPAAHAGNLDALLDQRRSTRDFSPQSLKLSHVADLAWAAQGSTTAGTRTCPSAHARYPLTLTVVAGNVADLPAGTYAYDGERQVLAPVASGDHRDAVARTTLADHDWLSRAPALLMLSGDLASANASFAEQPPHGRRGERYVWLEAGHASQNVYLRAAEAGLGAVLVAGFDDDRLIALNPTIVPSGQHPPALLGIGHRADRVPA